MHIPTFALLLTTLLFTSTTSACKCEAHAHGHYDAEERDCVAHSIAEKMSKFSYCCWLRTGIVGSDCKHRGGFRGKWVCLGMGGGMLMVCTVA
jgi:hypothetical protein